MCSGRASRHLLEVCIDKRSWFIRRRLVAYTFMHLGHSLMYLSCWFNHSLRPSLAVSIFSGVCFAISQISGSIVAHVMIFSDDTRTYSHGIRVAARALGDPETREKDTKPRV